MRLEDFWKKRERAHQKKLFKYSKYILNDHFVLVLIFFTGAVGYWYSEYVKTVNADSWVPLVIIWLLLFASLFVGQFASLLQPADKVFLLPLETHLSIVMKRMKRRSFVFPAVALLLISGAAMPLLAALGAADFSQWILLAATLLLLKDSELECQLTSFKIWNQKRIKKYQSMLYTSFFVTLFLFLFVLPWSGVSTAILIRVMSGYYFTKIKEENRWRWETLIQKEESRLQRIYRFINLFTDIPSIADRPKRRKWADGLIERMSSGKQQPYFYLYLRAFARGTSYSGLYIRLTVIGAVILWFSAQIELNMLIGCVFLYLTGFQLVPLYHHFDDSLLLRLYPVSSNGKMKSIQQLLVFLLGFSSIIFWLSSIYSLGFLNSLFLLLVFGVFVAVFVWVYVPYRLRRKKTPFEII